MHFLNLQMPPSLLTHLPGGSSLFSSNPVLIFHPRSRLEESDSEIEAIEPETDGNFKEERSVMSEEGEEEEEDEENYDEGEGEEEESEDEEEEDEGPPKPVKQPCILVFDSLGGKKDRQARIIIVAIRP